MKKNFIIPLLLIGMLPCLVACSDDDVPQRIQYLDIVQQLPVYYKISGENDLITIKNGVEDEILVFNSAEDVMNNLEEVFLNEYPSYLSVDFNQYTLVVKTSYKFPYEIDPSNSKFSIIFNPYIKTWQITEDIYIKNELSDDYYVERNALVINKFTGDNTFTYLCEEKKDVDISVQAYKY